jgi:hypothetical protein
MVCKEGRRGQLTKLCPERETGAIIFGKPAPWNQPHINGCSPESGIGAAASKKTFIEATSGAWLAASRRLEYPNKSRLS